MTWGSPEVLLLSLEVLVVVFPVPVSVSFVLVELVIMRSVPLVDVVALARVGSMYIVS